MSRTSTTALALAIGTLFAILGVDAAADDGPPATTSSSPGCDRVMELLEQAKILVSSNASDRVAVERWLSQPPPKCDDPVLHQCLVTERQLLQSLATGASPTPSDSTSSSSTGGAPHAIAISRPSPNPSPSAAPSAANPTPVASASARSPSPAHAETIPTADDRHEAVRRLVEVFRSRCVEARCEAARYGAFSSTLHDYVVFSSKRGGADLDRMRATLAGLGVPAIAGVRDSLVNILDTATHEEIARLPACMREVLGSGLVNDDALMRCFGDLREAGPDDEKKALAEVEAVRDAANARRVLEGFLSNSQRIGVDVCSLPDSATVDGRLIRLRELVRERAMTRLPQPLGAKVYDDCARCGGQECDLLLSFRTPVVGCAVGPSQEPSSVVIDVKLREQANERAAMAPLDATICHSDFAEAVGEATERALSQAGRWLGFRYTVGPAIIDSAVASSVSGLARSCPGIPITSPVNRRLPVHVHAVEDTLFSRELRRRLQDIQLFDVHDVNGPGLHLRWTGGIDGVDVTIARVDEAGAPEHVLGAPMRVGGRLDVGTDTGAQAGALELVHCLVQNLQPANVPMDVKPAPVLRSEPPSPALALVWSGLPELLDRDPTNDARGWHLAVADSATTGGALASLAAGVLTRWLYSDHDINSLAPSRNLNVVAAVLAAASIGLRIYDLATYRPPVGRDDR